MDEPHKQTVLFKKINFSQNFQKPDDISSAIAHRIITLINFHMQRRKFLQNSLAAAAGTALSTTLPFQAAAAAPTPPDDKFRVALIGANGMGWSNMRSLLKIPGVECVASVGVEEE